MWLLLSSLALAEPCVWNAAELSFAGTPVEQARCLLKPVRAFGVIGAERELPEPLSMLPGSPCDLRVDAVRSILEDRGIDEAAIGGDLGQPVCRWQGDADNVVRAKYFVIHDTALPVDTWPEDVNGPGWLGNDLGIWHDPIGHIFVNRMGDSVTMADFGRPSWWATKFERDNLQRHAGLFINIELVQPRMPHRDTGEYHPIPPDPGFTEAQYDRLALLYLAASLRRGQWLVPGFHGVIDDGIADAHDDPQGFTLESWARAVQRWVAEVGVRGAQ